MVRKGATRHALNTGVKRSKDSARFRLHSRARLERDTFSPLAPLMLRVALVVVPLVAQRPADFPRATLARDFLDLLLTLNDKEWLAHGIKLHDGR